MKKYIDCLKCIWCGKNYLYENELLECHCHESHNIFIDFQNETYIMFIDFGIYFHSFYYKYKEKTLRSIDFEINNVIDEIPTVEYLTNIIKDELLFSK